MTQPVQEPSQGRTDQAQEFRTRQLFRRPAPAGPGLTSGWTVVFGDGYTPVVTGDYQAIWQVPREIVGDGSVNFYIYDPSAMVYNYSTTANVEIWLYRVRNGGFVDSLVDSPIVIDDHTNSSRQSATPPVVAQGIELRDTESFGGDYDQIMIGIDVAGTAEGLSISVPIGVEQPAGSGYHIP